MNCSSCNSLIDFQTGRCSVCGSMHLTAYAATAVDGTDGVMLFASELAAQTIDRTGLYKNVRLVTLGTESDLRAVQEKPCWGVRTDKRGVYRVASVWRNEKRDILAEVQWPDTPFDVRQSICLLVRAGSEAHGTYVSPTETTGIDDRDLMGVCVPPTNFVLGLDEWTGKQQIKNEWDVVLHEFRKFVRLLCSQNPNAIVVLWTRECDRLFVTPAGQALIENRDLFRDRNKAYRSFRGYADSQVKDMMRAGTYNGQMGSKRKLLVDRFGFDCKSAAHAVRLLRMGCEYLRTGVLNVWRVDASDMVAIKQGKRSLADVKLEIEKLSTNLDEAYKESKLPEEIDRGKVNEIVVSALKSIYC